MRVIKFRAWDKRVKRFVDFDGMYFEKNSFDMLVHKHKQTIKDHIILNQYTGLLDKNGVEIYEGDIIKNSFGFGHGSVYYSAPTFGLKYKKGICTDFTWEDFNTFEVIGNIYENPELLK